MAVGATRFIQFTLATLCLSLASCAWPQFGGGPSRTGAVASPIMADDAAALTRIWSQGSGDRVGPQAEPVSDGRRVFVVESVATCGICSDDWGRVVAFDLATGTRLWTTEHADATRWSPPAVADGLVIASGRLCVLAYEIDTGEERWRQCVPEPPSGISPSSPGTPTVSDGLIYVAWNSELAELRLQDGVFTGRSFVNHWEGGLAAIGEGRIALGTIFDRVTGEELWEDPAPAARAIRDGVLYSSTFAGELAAFDLDSGDEAWRISLACSGGATPAIGDTAIYLNECGTVRAFDRATGTEHWHTKSDQFGGGGERPTLAGGLLFMTNGLNKLDILDSRDGNLVRSVPLGAPPGSNLGLASPIVVGRYVVVAGKHSLDVYAPA